MYNKFTILYIHVYIQYDVLYTLYHFYTQDVKDDSTLQHGFIAQEVQKLFPEIVKENNDRLTVTYDFFVPLLWKAAQQLKQQNIELQLRVDRLEQLLLKDL